MAEESTTTAEQPQFEHDCDRCIFLGRHEKYDLYFCPTEPTVIARYGVDGDYLSGLDFTNTAPSLREAGRRAVTQGLLVEVVLASDYTVDWFEDVNTFDSLPKVIVPPSTLDRWKTNRDAFEADEQERRRLHEAARNHN